jgi:hypothetical protein
VMGAVAEDRDRIEAAVAALAAIVKQPPID